MILPRRTLWPVIQANARRMRASRSIAEVSAAVRLTLVLVLIGIPLVIPAVAQTPDEVLIVPGERMGRVKLSHSIEEIIQLHGQPSTILENPNPLLLEGADAYAQTIYYWKNAGVIVATRDQSKIEYIFLDTTVPLTRGYKTERGIARGTSRDAVGQILGQPQGRNVTLVLQNTPVQERWIYDTIGLFLSLVAGNVQTIGVFRPGQAKSYWKF